MYSLHPLARWLRDQRHCATFLAAQRLTPVGRGTSRQRPKAVEGFVQDLKHSFRSFIQTPSFTLAAVAALALGIGANTAIFSVVNTVLLRPVPAPDPERVVVLATRFPEGPNYLTSDQKFTLWRQQTGILKDLAGFRYGIVNVTGVDTPEQAQVSWVTSDYFQLYGISLARGRVCLLKTSCGPRSVVT